jgi:hypothetical protein
MADDRAWQAVNLVAAASGFGVIVVDLGEFSRRRLRPWQARQWLRLRRALENTPTVLVLLTGARLTGSVSSRVIELAQENVHWTGQEGVSLLLDGISTRARILHPHRQTQQVEIAG